MVLNGHGLELIERRNDTALQALDNMAVSHDSVLGLSESQG